MSRFVGAEFGATTATTRLTARTLPKPTWMSSVSNRKPSSPGGAELIEIAPETWVRDLDALRILHVRLTAREQAGYGKRHRQSVVARAADGAAIEPAPAVD